MRPRTDGKLCEHCSGWIPYPLKRCRRRVCPAYAPIWAGDQRRKLFANLDAYADQVPGGVKAPQVCLTAVTAPGARELPWDEDHCRALGRHRHSGELGCRVNPHAAEEWNRTAPARWRLMHGEAYRRTRRDGLRPWMLVRVWEMQKRGVLHVHPVLAFSTPAEKRAAQRYVEHLDSLRRQYGFGFVERKQRCSEPRAAAAYLSSYFVRGKGGKATLEQSVRSNRMPRSIVHVSVLLTGISGVTMRSLRMRRYLWWRLRELPRELARALHDRDRFLALCDELQAVEASLARGP